MKKKIQKENLEKELAEVKDLLQRVQADFVNYKRRQEEEREAYKIFAKENIILKILPVLDNLNRAFKHLPKELEKNDWVLGLVQIEKQFEEILEKEGVKKIETKNQIFDARFHEALLFEESKNRKSGEIIEELEPGYMLADKVIRPAKVVIAKDAE